MILLDMTIPGASSQEVVAEAVNAMPDIKVILTSAYSKEMIDGTMNSAQIHSFIRKPFQVRGAPEDASDFFALVAPKGNLWRAPYFAEGRMEISAQCSVPYDSVRTRARSRCRQKTDTERITAIRKQSCPAPT